MVFEYLDATTTSQFRGYGGADQLVAYRRQWNIILLFFLEELVQAAALAVQAQGVVIAVAAAAAARRKGFTAALKGRRELIESGKNRNIYFKINDTIFSVLEVQFYYERQLAAIS